MIWILLFLILLLWIAQFGFNVGGIITTILLIGVWAYLLLSLQKKGKAER